jgi:hypothetical protein
MPGDDDAPLSSYSDPLYDRLDAVARHVRRLWWVLVLAVLLIAATAVAVRLWMHREPTAIGAALAVEARNERDPAKREAAWTVLADGAEHDPGFRAAADIELVQIALGKGDAITARDRAQKAEEQARLSENDDLKLAAALSRAAAVLDGGDAAAALALYEKASSGAGARHPARKLAAEFGAAHCLEKTGKIDEAIARLEPLTTRSDRGAEDLIKVATATYWRLKRQQAGGAARPAEQPPVAKPAEVPVAAPAPSATAAPAR